MLRRQQRRQIRTIARQAIALILSMAMGLQPAGILADPVIVPQLNAPQFQSQDLQPYFALASGAGNQSTWEAIVADARAVLIANWEAAVDAQINSEVSAVSESDAFNDVNAYRDYLRESLALQKAEAEAQWQLGMAAAIEVERGSYVDVLGRRNREQIESETAESTNDLQQDTSAPAVDQARDAWEAQFESQVEDGLAQYQNALAGLFTNYEEISLEIQERDQEFASDQQRIEQYEQLVRDGIQQATDQLEATLQTSGLFYVETCDAQNICTTDLTTLSAEGQELQTLIADLRAGLQNDAPLSALAQQLTDYLALQEQRAQQREQHWQSRVNGSEWHSTTMDLSSYVTNWGLVFHINIPINGEGQLAHIPGLIYDMNAIQARDDLAGVVAWLSSGDTTRLRQYLANRGEYREISAIDWANFTNFEGIGASWSLSVPDMSPWMAIVDLAAQIPFGLFAWQWFNAAPNPLLEIAYTWHDPNAEANQSTWAGYRGALQPMHNAWATDILGAIQTWEQQTAQFDAEYATFQAEAAAAMSQAQLALSAGQQEIINSRSAWLAQMQETYRKGDKAFDAASGVGQAAVATVAGVSPVVPQFAAGSDQQFPSLQSLPKLSSPTRPDSANLDAILKALPTTITGISNLAVAAANNSQAVAAEKSVLEAAANYINGQSPAGGPATWTTQISADGRLTGTRQVHTGKAVQKAGTDGTSYDHYDAVYSTQDIQFTGGKSVRLASTGDLFSAWDYDAVHRDFEQNQAIYQEQAEHRLQTLDRDLNSANDYARKKQEEFQKNLDTAVENAQFVKAVVEAAIQAMLGGASGGQAWTSAIQGQVRSKIGGAIAEATGLPASFITAVLGGAKPHQAAMSWLEGEMWSTFETEMSKATGLPLNGVLSTLWKNNEKKKADKVAKQKAMVNTAISVAAVVAGPLTGGASIAALAAIKGAQGYTQGGLQGAVMGAAGAVASSYTSPFGVNVDLSYSYENGFGAGVSAGVSGGPAVGLSVSQRGGVTASAGFEAGGGMLGLRANVNGGKLGATSVGYTNTATGLSLGANYSPGGGLSGYAAITTDKGGQAGAGMTSVGVGFSRDEGAGAFVQRGNLEDGQGRLSYTERDGVGATFRNENWEVGASERGGQTLAITGIEGVDLRYNSNDGFSGSVVLPGTGGKQVTYSDRTGWNVALNEPDLIHGHAMQIGSLDQLSANASRITAERTRMVEQNAQIDDLRKGLEDLGLELTADQEEYYREHPEKLAAAVRDLGNLDAATGNEERTAGVGSSREGFLDWVTGGFEDAYNNIVHGTISNDRGFIDPKTGEYRQRICFVAGTRITVPEGYKNIEDIEVGDTVLAWNEATGQQSWRTVTHLFVRHTAEVYTLQFENGEIIETTWNHPFYVTGMGWVEAKSLRAGDGAINSRGERVQIASVARTQRPEVVYNIEVSGAHTYYVGESQVLVHNYNDGVTSNARPAGSYWDPETRDSFLNKIGNLLQHGSYASDLDIILEARAEGGFAAEIAMVRELGYDLTLEQEGLEEAFLVSNAERGRLLGVYAHEHGGLDIARMSASDLRAYTIYSRVLEREQSSTQSDDTNDENLLPPRGYESTGVFQSIGQRFSNLFEHGSFRSDAGMIESARETLGLRAELDMIRELGYGYTETQRSQQLILDESTRVRNALATKYQFPDGRINVAAMSPADRVQYNTFYHMERQVRNGADLEAILNERIYIPPATNRLPGVLEGLTPGRGGQGHTNGYYTTVNGKSVWKPGHPNYWAIDLNSGALPAWTDEDGRERSPTRGQYYAPVAPGEVVRADHYGGYGNAVIVDHGNGVRTLYGHNDSLPVTVGDQVGFHTPIGRVGNTGTVAPQPSAQRPDAGTHIHFELLVNQIRVDSRNFNWERFEREGDRYVSEFNREYGPGSRNHPLTPAPQPPPP